MEWNQAAYHSDHENGDGSGLPLGRRKTILITYKFVSFIAGGVAGAAAGKVLQLRALRLPAGIPIVLRTWLVAYCVTRLAPFG
jgi:hypothetical protein